MNIKKKNVGSKKNIKKRGLVFHYYIRADPLLGIGYVAIIRILCICYECLRKLSFPWNRRQDKYNKDRYKDANKKCVYWTILGPYDNWKIIHFY